MNTHTHIHIIYNKKMFIYFCCFLYETVQVTAHCIPFQNHTHILRIIKTILLIVLLSHNLTFLLSKSYLYLILSYNLRCKFKLEFTCNVNKSVVSLYTILFHILRRATIPQIKQTLNVIKVK